MLIRVEGLTHIYAPHTPLAHIALQGINLQIGPGERVGIMGATGSGKSTLVQHIAGLLRPTRGVVRLDGVVAHGRSAATRATRRRIGLAFQYPEDQIFERTVFREVGFGLRNANVPSENLQIRVYWALELVGLTPESITHRNPLTLSGGEMRRVALASVLSMQPEVLILDEPTAGMDPRGQRDILDRIRSWQVAPPRSMSLVEPSDRLGWAPQERTHKPRPTLIVVSHNVAAVSRLVDRVILLHDGRLAADGPVSQVLSDVELLAANGLEPPPPIMLLHLLRNAGWHVRTNLLHPEPAAAEIARRMNPHLTHRRPELKDDLDSCASPGGLP
jgi:energy-coupling factor transport system ATP-binding protein